MMIPLSSPDLTERDMAAVREVLCGPQLSLGPKLPAFEGAIAERAGVRHAVAVNSGTSALHLCVKAAEVGEGDEVITTPFSFVASANCVLFENGTPVFVDIDPVTWNIDPNRIEAAITPRTKAILPVHVFGRPCPMDKIVEIARRHGLAVIEDACEAIGARYKGRPVGSFGETGVFAFYPNKQLTTGEGGAIATDDPEVAALCRSWRNQGRGEGRGWLLHERLGYNYRLSDINCALGLTQIERLDEILLRRAHLAALYTERIQRIPQIIPPSQPVPDTEMSWFVYVIRLQDDFTREDRDAVLERLRARGIGCNDYFTPIHLQPFYRSRFGFRPGDFPITESVSERTIALPFYNQLTEKAVERVCRSLREAVRSLRPRRAVA